MSIDPGYTNDEVRSHVHAYEHVTHGQKKVWLAAHGISQWKMYRWRRVVFEGDLDRGLVPRETRGMSSSARRGEIARDAAAATQKALAAKDAELARQAERIRELEGANDALGKAIGLLHELNEHEPDDTATTEARSSSTGRKPSSQN